MFHSNVLAVFCFFALASFILAQEVSEGCDGDTLVEQMKTISEKLKCWFNDKHHYLITFKNQLMHMIEDRCQKLLKASNDEASDECKREAKLQSCNEVVNKDDQSKCCIENSAAMINTYHDLNLCMKKILAPKMATTTTRLLAATISGWKAVHTTC